MKSQNAVERAIRLVTPAPTDAEKAALRTTLNVLLNDARMEFAEQTAASDDRDLRNLLRKTFEVVTTNDSGLVDLTPLLTAAEPMLLKFLNTTEIFCAGISRKATLLPDESTLSLERPSGFPFAALQGTTLKVMNGGQPFVGEVTIRGSFVPALANINGPQLEEPFVLVLHSLGSKQIPSPMRTQAKEVKAVAAEK